MNVLLAFDKFKDALSAKEACVIASEAIADAQPNWTCQTAPLADGGDGFCVALVGYTSGEIARRKVTGPLGSPVHAILGLVPTSSLEPSVIDQLGWEGAGQIGIIELAQSSGIALTPIEGRSPWQATTAGLGEMIAETRRLGCIGAIIGLGGSATHDLGLGALWQLGFRFFDSANGLLDRAPTPETWSSIKRIERPRDPLPANFALALACDVENPLLGDSGAAAVFGPQKGLQKEAIEEMDSLTRRLATLLCQACATDLEKMEEPGVGAAGGTAFGLSVGLGARIVSGYGLVKAWTGLQKKLEAAEIVVTGEGRLDASSFQGKGPGALIREAHQAGKRTFAFAGSLGDELEINGLEAIAISPEDVGLQEAIARTEVNLRAAVSKRFRSF